MEKLTESPDFELLIDGLADGVFLLDRDGYFIYANRSAGLFTGYAPAELVGLPLYTFYDEKNDRIKTEYELGEAKKKGSYTSEGWKTRKDKTVFWAELSISALYNEHKQLIGYSGTIRDVSEKKKKELELRSSEERYRLMVEGVKEYAIFLLSPEGNILTWNEGAKRIKGYSPSEIIGRHFSVFYTSEDLQDKKPEREIEIAIRTGKYEEEGWRVKKNGSVFWANIVLTALFDDANKLVGFSKVTRDLTDRKVHEEDLRQSEERYRSLVEQVVDYGIFLLDEKGRIVSWNEGARKLKGYTTEEIIGKHFSIFYPEEDIINGKPARELEIAMAVGKYEEEGWRLKKDGSRFWANILITAVYNNSGAHIGFSKVTRDLTERKEAERALLQSYEQYRELAKELKVINEELSYANKELEQYTSIVSHDLQEPLRTVKSFLQLIEIRLAKGEYEGLDTYISKSISAANRMKELIQSLLYYSHLSKGTLVTETVAVDEIIGQALMNLKTSIDRSEAELVVENEVDTIVGDRVQLVQLVQNLLSNAIKFVDRDKPQVRLSCKWESGQVKIAVSDNGIGIEKSEMDKIFEIFRKLNTQKEYPGTGVGLAICKKIVDRHHGKIWVESELGEGTTFYITLDGMPAEKLLTNGQV